MTATGTVLPRPTIRGVIVIDGSAHVDVFGCLDSRAVAGLVPKIPAGVAVRIDIGAARVLVGGFGQVVAGLRDAGSVEVVGREPAGIDAAVQQIRRATLRVEAG